MDKSIKISMILLLLAGTLTLCACNADNKPAQTVNTVNTGTPVTPKTAAQTVDVMKSPTVSIQNKQATLTIPDEWLPKPEPEVVPEEEPVPEEKPSGKKAQTKQTAPAVSNPAVSDPAAALLLDGVPLDIGLTPEEVPIADMNPTVNTSSESSESSSDVAYSKDDTAPAKEAKESYNWE